MKSTVAKAVLGLWIASAPAAVAAQDTARAWQNRTLPAAELDVLLDPSGMIGGASP